MKKTSYKIQSVEDLYQILPEEHRNEYSIGMHGIDGDYFEKTKDGEDEINVTINKNHIAFNNGKVSDSFFKDKKNKLEEMMINGTISEAIIKETADLEELNKLVEISKKYGISSIMEEDYMSLDYAGYSSKMYDTIDSLILSEISDKAHEIAKPVSLVKLGEKSYQHFGSRIGEKLKVTFNTLKSRFFSKHIDTHKEDLNNEI